MEEYWKWTRTFREEAVLDNLGPVYVDGQRMFMCVFLLCR